MREIRQNAGMAGDSKFTEEIWRGWLEPFKAVRLLIEAGLDDREHAVNWLKGHLRRGALKAGGLLPVAVSDDPMKIDFKFGRYKDTTWNHIAVIPWKDDFWVSGNYEPDDPMDAMLRKATLDEFRHFLIDVRFDPAPILDFCARAKDEVSAGPEKAALPIAARRGAKRKDWWDHLWIEMIRRIRAGTLKPKSQAALQTLLEDYVRDELHTDVGDSTLKPMAANLFKYLQDVLGEIGENSSR